MADESPQIFRGLRGVYADTTTSSFIDGKVGKLLYRGYNIHDLAEKSTFEEIVYLLLYGELPTKFQLAEIDATLRSKQETPVGSHRGAEGGEGAAIPWTPYAPPFPSWAVLIPSATITPWRPHGAKASESPRRCPP